MVYKRGTKDMSYALRERTDYTFKTWEERHPGYGPGAFEATQQARANKAISTKEELEELVKINHRIAEVRDEKVIARFEEDFKKAVAEETKMLRRKEILEMTIEQKEKRKSALDEKKKLAEAESISNMSDVQLRKKERLERRERAIAAKAAEDARKNGYSLPGPISKVSKKIVAAAKGPVGILKNIRRGNANAAAEKRKKTLAAAISRKDDSLAGDE